MKPKPVIEAVQFGLIGAIESMSEGRSEESAEASLHFLLGAVTAVRWILQLGRDPESPPQVDALNEAMDEFERIQRQYTQNHEQN